jgi:hypothetical protein
LHSSGNASPFRVEVGSDVFVDVSCQEFTSTMTHDVILHIVRIPSIVMMMWPKSNTYQRFERYFAWFPLRHSVSAILLPVAFSLTIHQTKLQEAGWDCTVRSFIICTDHQMLRRMRWSDHVARMGYNGKGKCKVTSRDSSVGIALGYGLDDRGSRVRFPAGAGNFSLHHRVHNGSGAHPASYPMGTRRYFLRGKAAGAWSWPLTSI